ncbi:unnamed protein product [Coregonus sp. 'balchen']|nr:unnamed protein product [Coregonus sp. 'balchen']
MFVFWLALFSFLKQMDSKVDFPKFLKAQF